MKKKSKKKAAGVATVAVFSLLLFVAAGGLLYVNNLLNLVNRDVITGNASMTESEIYADEPIHNVSDSVEDLNDTKSDFEVVQKYEMLNESGIENILLIGSDRRSTNENGRSDSMMIVSINHNTGKIHIVSLMRAMYVYIPRASGGVWGMLNAAYSWGGPQLLIDTVEANFCVNIDRYVIVDFSSFTSVIDLVGGVDIPVTAAEAEYMRKHGCNIPSAGTYTLNGKEALTYSRIRYIDNDFVRTGRQRKVLEAVLGKMKTVNVMQLPSLANAVLPMLSTNLSNGEVLNYVGQASKLLSYRISQRMLPIENEDGSTYSGIMYVNGMEVYKVNYAKNVKALHEFLRS